METAFAFSMNDNYRSGQCKSPARVSGCIPFQSCASIETNLIKVGHRKPTPLELFSFRVLYFLGVKVTRAAGGQQ